MHGVFSIYLNKTLFRKKHDIVLRHFTKEEKEKEEKFLYIFYEANQNPEFHAVYFEFIVTINEIIHISHNHSQFKNIYI